MKFLLHKSSFFSFLVDNTLQGAPPFESTVEFRNIFPWNEIIHGLVQCLFWNEGCSCSEDGCRLHLELIFLVFLFLVLICVANLGVFEFLETPLKFVTAFFAGEQVKRDCHQAYPKGLEL